MPRIENWSKVPIKKGSMWVNDETDAEVKETKGNRGEGRTVWIYTVDGRDLALDINKVSRTFRSDYILIELQDATQTLDTLKAPADKNKPVKQLGHMIAVDYLRKHPKGRSETDITHITSQVKL